MSEPIREEPTPRPGEAPFRREMPPQPLRPTGERPTAVEERRFGFEAVSARDFVHWAPVWAGVFIPIGVLLLLSPLGLALGLSSGTGALIWQFLSLIVAFFVGGYVVGRTLSYDDSLLAGAHGLLSWAVALTLIVLLTVALGTALTAIVAGARAALGIPELIIPTTAAAAASVGTFFALLLSAAAAVVGAVVGNSSRPYPWWTR